jgi:hypothetical protein
VTSHFSERGPASPRILDNCCSRDARGRGSEGWTVQTGVQLLGGGERAGRARAGSPAAALISVVVDDIVKVPLWGLRVASLDVDDGILRDSIEMQRNTTR